MRSVFFLIAALLLMALAVFQTRSFFSYRERQKKRGSSTPVHLSPVTYCLYAAAALLLLFSLIAAFPETTEQPVTPPPETVHTTPSTEATFPEETEPTQPETVAPPQADLELTAKHYFVYDCNADTFLVASGDLLEKVYPASITKLFSVYVAKQYLEADTQVTVGAAVTMIAAGSSLAKLKQGDVLTVEQLIGGMILPSGNDAAYVLADAAGRRLAGDDVTATTAVNTFVEEMNRQAAALGLENTHFANPDGIHSTNHYTSMQDLATIGKLALQDQTISRQAATRTETVQLASRTLTWLNTNELLQPKSEFYCSYAVGLKTGRTKAAGNCLLSAFVYKGNPYIVGVFGCPKTEDRFTDTLELFTKTVNYEE